MSDNTMLLERFRRGPELLALVLTGVFGEEEDFVPSSGGWSIRTIVAHLADSELVGAHRMRKVMAEDDPALAAFDQDLWAARLDYARRKPKTSLESFRRIRAENYELVKDAPPEAWQRTGNHSERGRTTLTELVEGYAAHAESHARQIQQIRDAYKESRGKK